MRPQLYVISVAAFIVLAFSIAAKATPETRKEFWICGCGLNWEDTSIDYSCGDDQATARKGCFYPVAGCKKTNIEKETYLCSADASLYRGCQSHCE